MTRCRICRAEFVRRSMTHKACSPDCAAEVAKRAREKAERAEALKIRRADAIKRIALKSRAKLASEAQAAINAYVRARDADLPCVSCGRPPTWPGQWHASHFRSVGSRPDLRFDLANIHRACSICNTHLSGNLIGYRAELIRRIGQAEVDRLEGPATAEKLTRDELIALKRQYVAMRGQM